MLINSNLAVKYRIPMLMAGFISLAIGVYIGLVRMGWGLPLQTTAQLSLHAPLMVCGFLGTVISLERAVAIGQRWAYAAPLTAAIGALLLITGQPWWLGAMFMVIAGSILSLASGLIFMKQRELFTFTLLLGSLSWFSGCILWLLGFNMLQVMPWWMGFLTLTIFGERLELSRFLKTSRGSKVIFSIALCLFFIGAAIATFSAVPDFQFLSAALIVMTLWLIRNDIVRHTIKQQGLTRFIAVALASGYLWLLAGAVIGLTVPYLSYGSSYDAYTHAIFIGFVFAMIFGHAPIIFPAIAKIKIPYQPVFYLPLALLHLSLLLRVSGDLLYLANLRKAGGALHTITIVLFILVLARAVLANKRIGLSTK